MLHRNVNVLKNLVKSKLIVPVFALHSHTRLLKQVKACPRLTTPRVVDLQPRCKNCSIDAAVD